MIANGDLGDLRVVQVEYAQDWLTEAVEATGAKGLSGAPIRLQSGLGGATGDIGTHAFNLASFVTGLTLDESCRRSGQFCRGTPPGRQCPCDAAF